MPVRMVDVLGRLAAELEVSDVEAVIMPAELAWAEENIERDEQTFPADVMVERFIEIIKMIAYENFPNQLQTAAGAL